MIVCLCEGISDRTIRKEAQNGAKNCREVQQRCGAGGSCGMCRPSIRKLIKAQGNQKEK